MAGQVWSNDMLHGAEPKRRSRTKYEQSHVVLRILDTGGFQRGDQISLHLEFTFALSYVWNRRAESEERGSKKSA